jgi:tripartite-type tricarboxylate transporter receptor subunit TctC
MPSAAICCFPRRIFLVKRNPGSLSVAGLLTAFVSLAAGAQAPGEAAADYPARPIRIVVGFTPGGGPDITARYIAQKLGEAWKQQVLVENRPGAGGTVAAGMVARVGADGYTLLSVSSAHAIAAAIYPKLPYDVFADLSGVTQTATSKYVLVAPPSLGVRTLRELLAAAKARPGQLNFSSAGVGSGTHFAGELFKSMAAIDVVHVPFKGIPEALGDTITGRVQFFMAPIANAVNPVKEGRLVGLLVSSAVPRPIVAKLNGEISRLLSEPELKARWSAIGIEPQPDTPEAFDRLIREDVGVFTRIARASNIRAD